MKLLDWIKGIFNKNKLLDEPKQESEISQEEQFRKNMQEKAELTPEEIQARQIEEQRKSQIRLAGYNVINTSNNLDSNDIQINLQSKLLNLQMEQLLNTGSSNISAEVVLTDLDVETLKHIHFAVQSNPEFSSYLNSVDKTTRDNNIIEVVNRMQQIAKDEAKSFGYVDSQATKFMPNATNVIYQLQKEQQEQQMEKE